MGGREGDREGDRKGKRESEVQQRCSQAALAVVSVPGVVSLLLVCHCHHRLYDLLASWPKR